VKEGELFIEGARELLAIGEANFDSKTRSNSRLPPLLFAFFSSSVGDRPIKFLVKKPRFSEMET